MENKGPISINQYKLKKISKEKNSDDEYVKNCKDMIIALLEEIIGEVENGEWTSISVCLSSDTKRTFEYTAEERSFGNLCAALDMCKMEMLSYEFQDE